jgi:hypothetical protein
MSLRGKMGSVNPAGPFGALVFTNPPDATTNNFWRIRPVP